MISTRHECQRTAGVSAVNPKFVVKVIIKDLN